MRSRELALALREQVLPELGSHAGREHAGDGRGRRRHLRDRRARRGASWRSSSPSARPRSPSTPRTAAWSPRAASRTGSSIVDPIDGTRPAMAGFESACVSVAAAPLDGEPTMGDVGSAASSRSSRARASSPCAAGASTRPPRLSANTRPRADVLDLRLPRAPGGADRRGARRADRRLLGRRRDLRPRLGDLRHDPARHRAARRLRRAGPRIDRRGPRDARANSSGSGGGAVLNNSPYDLAAAVALPRGGGRGGHRRLRRRLGDRPLLGSGHEFQMSCVCASQTRSCTRRSSRRSTGASSACAAGPLGPGVSVACRACSRSPRRPASRSPTTPTSSARA